MPNMDVIHARQKMEGFEACFGRAEGSCHQTQCKWHAECQALTLFTPVRGLGLRPSRRPPTSNVTRATFGGFRDGGAPSDQHKGGPEQAVAASIRQDQAAPANELHR
jgi:hypothetical protein